MPGPRLLLIMKADVLSLPPVLDSNQSATFLAVLDIDFGRGTITIGIVAAYEIERILKIRVPITAFFDARQPEAWLVDLGSYHDRVTVEVLDVISGSGYLMVHGDGISLPTDPPLVVPNGIAVATGFHLQAVLMGSKSAGLYLEVAAGFDAILGLDPFYLGGIIYVRGELRLWIVGISASAKLVVQVGSREVGGVVVTEPYVHGEVCGSVDFFFFEVSGCVELTIGAPTTPTPDAARRSSPVSPSSRASRRSSRALARAPRSMASSPTPSMCRRALRRSRPATSPPFRSTPSRQSSSTHRRRDPAPSSWAAPRGQRRAPPRTRGCASATGGGAMSSWASR